MQHPLSDLNTLGLWKVNILSLTDEVQSGTEMHTLLVTHSFYIAQGSLPNWTHFFVILGWHKKVGQKRERVSLSFPLSSRRHCHWLWAGTDWLAKAGLAPYTTGREREGKAQPPLSLTFKNSTEKQKQGVGKEWESFVQPSRKAKNTLWLSLSDPNFKKKAWRLFLSLPPSLDQPAHWPTFSLLYVVVLQHRTRTFLSECLWGWKLTPTKFATPLRLRIILLFQLLILWLHDLSFPPIHMILPLRKKKIQ